MVADFIVPLAPPESELTLVDDRKEVRGQYSVGLFDKLRLLSVATAPLAAMGRLPYIPLLRPGAPLL